MKALIIGDIHAAWGDADDLIELASKEEGPFDCIIQVGDMGFCFPGVDPWNTKYDIPCMWIDGNHENHEMLSSRDLCPVEWKTFLKQWEYKERGTFENGILYIGGAKSIDRMRRTQGVDYWPQENLSREDENRIFDTIKDVCPDSIHTVISHDCPTSFDMQEALRTLHGDHAKWLTDHNNAILEEVRKRVMPDYWFFGHYHIPWKGHFEGCNWRCINMVGNTTEPDYAVLDIFTN